MWSRTLLSLASNATLLVCISRARRNNGITRMPDSLNPFDLFVIVIAVLSTFWGGMRGVVSQITSILSWLASWYVATHYYTFVARFIDQDSEWRVPASMVITFIVTALAIRLASNFIKQIVSFAGLKEFDRQMGALFGLCKGLLLCFMVAFLAVVASEKSRAVVENAKTGPFFVKSVAYVQDKLPESELTKKFRSIAGEIEEQGERDDKLEEQEAEVDNLRKGLISKGFLSNNASKIVEEAIETRSDSSQNGKDAQAQSNAFQSFLRRAAEWKEGFSNLTNGESASKSEPTSRTNSQAGVTGNAPPSFNDSTRNGSREYYPYDSASASLPDDLIGQDYYDASVYNSLTPDNRYNNFSTSDSVASSSSPANPSTQNVGTDSLDFSELVSFLNTFGGGFGGGNVGSPSGNSYSGAPSPSYNASSPPSSNGSERTATSQATNHARNSRSSDSSESRARLSSRSYSIGSPTN